MRVAIATVEVVDISRAARRSKFTFGLRPSPLSLAMVLLLYNLVSDKVDSYIGEPRSTKIPLVSMPVPETMLLRSEFKRSLADVHRSMIALPDQDDAWMVAKSISETRMSSLNSAHIISKIDEMKATHTRLVNRYEIDLARRQRKINKVQTELQRLKSNKYIYINQNKLMLDHDSSVVVDQSNERLQILRHQLRAGADNLERDLEEEPLPAPAYRDDITGGFANAQSRISDAGLFAEPSLRLAALQIARKLHEIRGKAVLSGGERAITIDVERGLFGDEESGGEFLQLDPRIELHLDTATSEVINEDSARVRFFPDGSATGGRIQLQSNGESATVNVAWSTGAATVQVDNN